MILQIFTGFGSYNGHDPKFLAPLDLALITGKGRGWGVVLPLNSPPEQDLASYNIAMEVTEFDSYIRGYHAYQDIWNPVVGESLLLKRGPDNSVATLVSVLLLCGKPELEEQFTAN